MAIYEFVCPSCKSQFERRLPMSQATTAVRCECGREADRKISLFALSGLTNGLDESMPMGGGCCGGGGCACGA